VLVHKWRASEQSILVGAETVRSDNPKLNVREWKGNNPLKIVLSFSGIFDKDSNVNETNGTLLVFTDNMNADIPGAIKVKLEKIKMHRSKFLTIFIKREFSRFLLKGEQKFLTILYPPDYGMR